MSRGSAAEYNGEWLPRFRAWCWCVLTSAWEKLGNPGWNWNTVNHHIKSVESFTPAPPEFAQRFGSEDAGHGTQGPINVSFSNYYEPSNLISTFSTAMKSLGVSHNPAAVRIYIFWVTQIYTSLYSRVQGAMLAYTKFPQQLTLTTVHDRMSWMDS